MAVVASGDFVWSVRRWVAFLPLLLGVMVVIPKGFAQSALEDVDTMPTGSVRPGVSEQILPGSTALMALSADAGMAIRVREQLYGNGAVQIIHMDGPAPHGENLLEVTVQTDPAPTRRDQAVPIYHPTEDGIRREISARFPDLRMQIVPRPMDNSFGPFGLAIGRYGDGTRCLFAWQWIDDVGTTTQGETGLSRLASAWSHKIGTSASVRVRLCRPDVSVDELAASMQGLTLGDATNLERVRAARNIVDPSQIVSPVANRRGGPTVIAAPEFVPDGSLESALGPETTPSAPPMATPPRRAVAHSGAQSAPGRAARSSAPSPKRAPADPGAALAESADGTLSPYSGAYLAPVGGQGSAQVAAPGYRTSALDGSLPPQALRGPSSSITNMGGNGASPYSR